MSVRHPQSDPSATRAVNIAVAIFIVFEIIASTAVIAHRGHAAVSRVTRLYACVSERTGVQRGLARAYEFKCRSDEQEVSWGVR